MMIRNVTVARNRVLGFHDWHYHAGGIVTMPHGYSAPSNSIVSDNAADLPAISPDCFGNIHSLGYNLVLTATNCFIGANATGNVLGESARLPALADNGGPTMTSLPPADSPAVDAANPAAPNADDARRAHHSTSAALPVPETATPTASLVATWAPSNVEQLAYRQATQQDGET